MSVKTTSASVSVKLSINYCSFEIVQHIESDSEEGVSLIDINETRKNCHRLAQNAVDQFVIKSTANKEGDFTYDFNDDKRLFPNATK